MENLTLGEFHPPTAFAPGGPAALVTVVHVVLMGPQNEMLRLYAPPVIACMANMSTCRYTSIDEFVSMTMSRHVNSTNGVVPVSGGAYGSDPSQTFTVSFRLPPEVILRRARHRHQRFAFCFLNTNKVE